MEDLGRGMLSALVRDSQPFGRHGDRPRPFGQIGETVMAFRQECAIATMREIVHAMLRPEESDQIRYEAIARVAFDLADAMIKAAGPELPSHGAAPSRT